MEHDNKHQTIQDIEKYIHNIIPVSASIAAEYGT
jgi:hypothetical protein